MASVTRPWGRQTSAFTNIVDGRMFIDPTLDVRNMTGRTLRPGAAVDEGLTSMSSSVGSVGVKSKTSWCLSGHVTLTVCGWVLV